MEKLWVEIFLFECSRSLRFYYSRVYTFFCRCMVIKYLLVNVEKLTILTINSWLRGIHKSSKNSKINNFWWQCIMMHYIKTEKIIPWKSENQLIYVLWKDPYFLLS